MLLSRRGLLRSGVGVGSLLITTKSRALGGGSSPDPYTFVELNSTVIGYQDLTGLTQKDPRLVAGQKTCVCVIAGQSDLGNYMNSQYTPSNAGVQQDQVYNGRVYSVGGNVIGASGLIGSTGGCAVGILADNFITAGIFDRFIIANVTVGGSACLDWAPGGVLNAKLLTIGRRLRAVGLTPTCYIWDQGQTEAGVTTTQAAYYSAISSVIASVRADGVSSPWFVDLSTYSNTVSNTQVRAAQAQVVDHSNGIWQGCDADSITGLTNRYDLFHYTLTGGGLWATAEKTAMAAYGSPFV